MFDRVHIAAFRELDLEEHEQLDSKRNVWRVPLASRRLPKNIVSQLLQYLEWMLKIVWRFRKEDIRVVHCHDLPALPIGVLLKAFKRSRVVYDAHELETETMYLSGIKKKMARYLETVLIRFADRLIVVSDSIAEWYKHEYDLKNAWTIRNVPYRPDNSSLQDSAMLKEKFGIAREAILFICQGVLKKNRGIELLLDVFSRSDSTRHIVFMGFGPLEGLVKEYDTKFPSIHFQPAVAPEEIIYYSKSADIGISLIENACLNYYYSLPNKVFEYILSGIPLVVSDFPDMGKIVDEYDCGWKVDPGNKEQIFQLVNNISLDDIMEKREGVQKCREAIVGWEKEEIKLKQLYQSLV